MKQGKKPTKKHKQAMEIIGLNANNRLVTKSLAYEIHLVHRETGRERIIPV